MGMTWNAETKSKLFCAVLKVHSISLDYEALAKEMGPDCTAKALKHQISILKNSGKSVASPAVEESKPTGGKTSPQKTLTTPDKKAAVAISKKKDSNSIKKPTAPTPTKKRGADQMNDEPIIFDYDKAAAKIEATKKKLGMRKKIKIEEGTVPETEDHDEGTEEKAVGEEEA